MCELTKDQMVAELKKRIVTITFQKVDGSKRVMKATLIESYIPPSTKTTDRVRVPNPNTISVVDTEIHEWRSFRIDSVLSFE